VPTLLEKSLDEADEEKSKRTTKCFLGMKKFDLSELKKAADGE
jgi:hypothetical protein